MAKMEQRLCDSRCMECNGHSHGAYKLEWIPFAFPSLA
jgi:hypothetical protein